MQCTILVNVQNPPIIPTFCYDFYPIKLRSMCFIDKTAITRQNRSYLTLSCMNIIANRFWSGRSAVSFPIRLPSYLTKEEWWISLGSVSVLFVVSRSQTNCTDCVMPELLWGFNRRAWCQDFKSHHHHHQPMWHHWRLGVVGPILVRLWGLPNRADIRGLWWSWLMPAGRNSLVDSSQYIGVVHLFDTCHFRQDIYLGNLFQTVFNSLLKPEQGLLIPLNYTHKQPYE